MVMNEETEKLLYGNIRTEEILLRLTKRELFELKNAMYADRIYCLTDYMI